MIGATMVIIGSTTGGPACFICQEFYGILTKLMPLASYVDTRH
jgi:hypothetical protein